MITVTTLIEETKSAHELISEHGLSLYIETAEHNILFDTGASGSFADNAQKLGIDLSTVDIAFLSHAHYDHGGGLKRFMELNSRAKIYANRRVFNEYWAADGRYVGIDPSLKDSGRFVLAGDELKIDDELSLFTYNNNERKFPMGSYGLLKKEAGELKEDDFLHEQYLKIYDGEEYVLISGCSHKGILNILSWCGDAPRAVIGGFHFMKVKMDDEGKRYLTDVAERLSLIPSKLITCHCTGDAQYVFLNERMNGALMRISTGDRIRV